MKTGDGYACDKCFKDDSRITDNEVKRGETLHYGRVDYHTSCYVQWLRNKGAIPKERAA